MFMIAKPSEFVNPPMWLGPSSGHGEAVVTMAWHLPLVTLCSPAEGECCSDVGIAADMIEG